MLGFYKEPVEFTIKKPVMGIGRSRYQNGILKSRDKKEIAMLRRLPDNHVEEVGVPVVDASMNSDELAGLSWHEIQKMGAEKGILRTGMDREAIEQAIREVVSNGDQIA